MLLGCCHCGEESDSEPPSDSAPPSESQPPSEDSLSESSGSSLEVVSCFCVFPRRWAFTLPGPNRVGASPCCTSYAGNRILHFVQCTNPNSVVWATTERRSTIVTDPTCNALSSLPMFQLQITKGVTNTTIVLSSNPGTINFTYSVANASFNCLSPFILDVASAVGAGGAQCYGTPSSYLITFSPG